MWYNLHMNNAFLTWLKHTIDPLLRNRDGIDEALIKNSLLFVMLCGAFVLCLGGCGTVQKDRFFVPEPPLIDMGAGLDVLPQSPPIGFDHAIYSPEPADLGPAEAVVEVVNGAEKQSLNQGDQSDDGGECSVRDRFDRDALLAYEWKRNRLAMDVEGVNFNGGNAGVMLTYTVRLSPEKTKDQKCRYQSKWQGLIGSGYNELMVREDDTLRDHFGRVRREFVEHLNNSF